MELKTLKQEMSSNPPQVQNATQTNKREKNQMEIILGICLATHIAGLSFASQPLSMTAIKAIEAQNQMLNDYAINSTYGFSEPRDITGLAVKAETQYLNNLYDF